MFFTVLQNALSATSVPNMHVLKICLQLIQVNFWIYKNSIEDQYIFVI